MTTTAVIKHFDVFKQVRDGFAMRAIPRAVHPLVLQAIEEAFRRRVIPATAFAAHRAAHAVRAQLALEFVARILTASVRVMQHTRRGPATEPCHRQRVGYEVRRHARLDGPAHDLPVEQVQRDRQIQPAFVGPDVRDVRGEHLIGLSRREVAVQHVRRHRQLVPGIGCHAITAFVAGSDTVVAHQPLHTCFAGWKPGRANLFGHARRAVGAFDLDVNRPNQREQLRIGQPLTLGRAAALPGAIAIDAYTKDLAQRRQRIVPALRVNPGELHRRSFAKNAAAFFAISSSICKRLFSARRRESSICSAVTTFAPAPFSLPASEAFSQLRSVCVDIPNSRATALTPCPSLTRCTAASLNSAVYTWCGTLNIPSFLPLGRVYTRPTGRQNFRGSSGITREWQGCWLLQHDKRLLDYRLALNRKRLSFCSRPQMR